MPSTQTLHVRKHVEHASTQSTKTRQAHKQTKHVSTQSRQARSLRTLFMCDLFSDFKIHRIYKLCKLVDDCKPYFMGRNAKETIKSVALAFNELLVIIINMSFIILTVNYFEL